MRGLIVAAMTTFAVLSSSLAVAGVGHEEGKKTASFLKKAAVIMRLRWDQPQLMALPNTALA